MPAEGSDSQIRLAAFAHLNALKERYGDVLELRVLREGFEFRGNRVKYVGPKGIFKPAMMELPLSITTVPPNSRKERPYDDSFGPDGLRYRHRGEDPKHPDNVGLRRAMQRQVPLVYFHGIVPGRYCAEWPVFIVGDDSQSLTFHVAIDDPAFLTAEAGVVAESGADARRQYVTTTAKVRLHQRAFRERVLDAYRRCCALCRLKHAELLDAAHILPDNDPRSEPVVQNGIALCKLHHAAFDRYFLGLRPDGVVEVRPDILDEIDGPMLIHGLQGLHGSKVAVPRRTNLRPRYDFLEERYEAFLATFDPGSN